MSSDETTPTKNSSHKLKQNVNMFLFTTDDDDITLLVRRWDSDVDVALLHQTTDLSALLPDDVAMKLIGNGDFYLDWDQFLE